MTHLLEIEGLTARYGSVEALRGIDLHLREGQVVSVLGPNGVGKTTLLKRIGRLLTSGDGRVTVDGVRIDRLKPHEMISAGVTIVPEGRAIFRQLTVAENLEIARRATLDAGREPEDPQRFLDEFPRLGERRTQMAGSLSGGEQQMLSIAKALVTAPRVLAVDEPSLGLAQKLVVQVLDRVRRISESGVAVLLVEQNARMALRYSDHAYVLDRGQVAFHGPSRDLLDDERMENTYLGRPLK